jgi:3-isopropylmalate/(R)-2-methylmalate dehydratase large subunit
MRITVNGKLHDGVSAKDVILYIISQLGVDGGTGYFVEYAGSTIQALSMEGRMTICNMSIEMGARGGLIAPDDTTYAYLENKTFAPKGDLWIEAKKFWKTLVTDDDAQFDKEYYFEAEDILPMITFGTNPGMGMSINGKVKIDANSDSEKQSLKYMGIEEGESLIGKEIQHVFIGSCTNARIEDLRLVAHFLKGKKKANHVNVMIVPGSKAVADEARNEGLDVIFEQAGIQMREAGCSACLGMNEDKIPMGEYCVSTSNRNFEGRQGQGARTILASPLTAAAAIVTGKIVDVREYLN